MYSSGIIHWGERMNIRNFSLLKSRKLICEKALADYIKSRSIMSIGRDNDKYCFMYNDILEEIMGDLPSELRGEVYNIE